MHTRMRERIIIVFVAVAIGLIVTTLIFFLYQQTKTIPDKTSSNESIESLTTEEPTSNILLTIDTPSNESITDNRSVAIKGKTNPGNTIIISTNQEDEIIEPTTEGAFSTTVTIGAGSNEIVTRAITPSGEETSDTRVITFSTEEF